MALVSVIIPALNEAENINKAINAAKRGYAADEVEIIVADGGSRDGMLERIPKGITIIQSQRGRAIQMNHGAAVSHGDILAFCHADSQLPQYWREAIIDVLSDPSVSGGTFQTLILPAFGLLKLRNKWIFPPNWKIMFGDQVQFMRRETFNQMKGFPEIPLMEDLEMSRSLHQAGTLVRIPPHIRVVTSSRRFKERGLIRQTLLNFININRYLYFGVSADEIVKSYRSSREDTVSDVA